MENWFENDAFWKEMAPYLFAEQRWDATAGEVEDVVKLLGLGEGANVLDLCCGPGRHSLELRRRGFGVTAVDRYAPYLEELRGRDGSVETVCCDMRDFVRESAFDGALNLWTSFGYFDDEADDLRVARNVFGSLRPGGAFLIEVMGKEPLAKKFRPRDWHLHDDGSILLEDRSLIDGWRRIEARWTLLRGTERFEFSFHNRLYSGVELSDLLLEAGFASVDLYGAFDGRPYDHEALRLVACGRKAPG